MSENNDQPIDDQSPPEPSGHDLDDLGLEPYSFGEWAWLALCTLIGGALRAVNLAGRPLWTDELTTIITSQRPLAQSFTTSQDPQPPLHQLLVRLLTGGGGPGAAMPSEQMLRSPACFFGIATIPAAWWCARHFLGRVGAGFAALLIALNPLLIHHARDARPYALYAFFATLSITFFHRLVKTGGKLNVTGYALATIGMFFSHYYAMFFVAAQLAYVVIDFILGGPSRRHRGPVLLALVAAFLGSLPVLMVFAMLLTGGMKGSWWIRPPTGFAQGFDALGDLLGVRAIGVLCVVPLVSAFWLAGLSESPRSIRTIRFWSAWWLGRERAIYLALLVGFALFVPVFVSMIKPAWVLRYSLAVTVPMIILGLAYLRSKGPVVTAMVLLVVLALGANKARHEIRNEPGLREAVAAMMEHKAAGDAVFLPDWKFSEDFILPEAMGARYYGYTGDYVSTHTARLDAYIYRASKTLDAQEVAQVLANPDALLPGGTTWAVCFYSTAKSLRGFLIKRGRLFEEWEFGEPDDAGTPMYTVMRIAPR
jgi:hypothetical protein